MKAILVRVGIDQTYGGWNAPVDVNSGEFVYAPIPEFGAQHDDCQRSYGELVPVLEQFAASHGLALHEDLRFPQDLSRTRMHLDPDFQYLTYGDDGDRRGSGLRKLSKGDLVVFYAGLRPIKPGQDPLCYALIGLLVVEDIVEARLVPKLRRDENAHTRRVECGAGDIIVRGQPAQSGRLARCVPIGEFRNKAYRVRCGLLEAWGGLTVKDGFLQRSARPPLFLKPERFHQWFLKHEIPLLRQQNPTQRVVVVILRQPDGNNPREMRSDPFWEFGSFGCTHCHEHNLMNPAKASRLIGARLAFSQGGRDGFKLVFLSPPITIRKYTNCCEAHWEEGLQKMPFKYGRAPLLVNNNGETDFPALRRMIESVQRSTWMGKLASEFRARCRDVPTIVAREILSRYYHRLQAAHATDFAESYDQAMDTAPCMIDRNRADTYRRLTQDSSLPGRAPRCRKIGASDHNGAK